MKILPTIKKCTGNAVTKAGEVSASIQVGSQRVKSKIGRALDYEQHIALFGEEGSGKTTLLNVFYGKQQELRFVNENGYTLLAEKSEQGVKLLSGYNSLKDSGETVPTRLFAEPFSFLVKPKFQSRRKGTLKIVWHDYPGEWLSGSYEKTPEEECRKLKTFTALINSDVAYILVDGKRLKEQGGGYIKRMISQLKDELMRLKDGMSSDFPAKHFPRVWTICLSKADLFPTWKVGDFKGEVLKFAGDEIESLKSVLGQFVKHPEKLELPNGYLLLSSAQYDPETLKLVDWQKTLGVDGIAPLSVLAPILASLKWANVKTVGTHVLWRILKIGAPLFFALSTLPPVIAAFINATVIFIPWVGPILTTMNSLVASVVAAVLAGVALAMRYGEEGLRGAKEKAEKRRDGLRYIIAAFQAKLHECKDEGVYVEHAPYDLRDGN